MIEAASGSTGYECICKQRRKLSVIVTSFFIVDNIWNWNDLDRSVGYVHVCVSTILHIVRCLRGSSIICQWSRALLFSVCRWSEVLLPQYSEPSNTNKLVKLSLKCYENYRLVINYYYSAGAEKWRSRSYLFGLKRLT